MKTFDNEDAIISYFQKNQLHRPVILGNKKRCKKILKLLLKTKITKWSNSSGKNDAPPDFYNDKHLVMMEVMRVEDHSHINTNGDLINLTAVNEKKVYNFIQRKYRNIISDDAFVLVNAPTGLPTNEDHRISWYKENFERVIMKHSKKIKNYKKNHPGYSLIFFVMDESSAYVQPKDIREVNRQHKAGEPCMCLPHYCFFDLDFVKTIKESGADFLVWYTPFKKIIIGNNKLFPLPHTAIYDIENLSIKDNHFQRYETSSLMSAEI